MSAVPCVQDALPALQRAGYALVAGVPPWGRAGYPVLALTSPDGSPLVAKLYTNGSGRAAYDHIQGLWVSSFGTGRVAPRLPRAVAYLEEIGALIMQRLDGRPLGACGPVSGPSVVAAMELLAALHSSDARPSNRQSSEDLIRSLRDKVGLVDRLAPAVVAPFRSLVDALESARPPSVEAVPSHGDFCPRNLFTGSDTSARGVEMALIDWDRFRLAEPAQDIASFGASSWGRDARAGREPDWSVLEKAEAVYGRLLPTAAVHDGIRFYTAARLARMCHILVKRPHRAAQVPRLLDEARRLLR